MLPELRCHQEFKRQGAAVRFTTHSGSSSRRGNHPSARDIGPAIEQPPMMSCLLSCCSGPHSALGIWLIILSQPSFWKSLVAPHTLREAGNQ